MSTGNRGDLGVEWSNGSSDTPPLGADRRVSTCRGAVEWQDTALEVFRKQKMCGLIEPRASPAGWQ